MTELNQDELLQDLENSLAAPQEVSTGAGTVKQYSITDKIKALEYLEKKRAEERTQSSLGRVKIFKFRRN